MRWTKLKYDGVLDWLESVKIVKVQLISCCWVAFSRVSKSQFLSGTPSKLEDRRWSSLVNTRVLLLESNNLVHLLR